MKRFILIIVLVLSSVSSCSIDDYSTSDDYTIELLPIESIELPDSFFFNETYSIAYSYMQPTSCHLFHDLYYNVNEDERTLAVLNKKLDNNYCQTLDETLVTNSFEFHCSKENGAYSFKIWQGEDEQGEAQYLIYEVPIVN
ncbi:MAG: hypothetical protein HRT67_11320 [Flavobacteriaceae bacterium]|nr:hypothetical protein [Flavobacteriaceae bacterium]